MRTGTPLWDYVLRADRAADLADPAAGWAWFIRQGWMPRDEKGEPAWGDWTAAENREWQQCLFALRSLARRLKGRRARPIPGDAPGSDIWADAVRSVAR